MKALIIITTILLSCSLTAQDQYTKGMGKAMELWGQNKTTEAVAMFERISQAEKENWLPAYYAANVLITASFGNTDKNMVNEMLEQAKVHIATAHKRSPNNSEITTMEGLLYTGYVAMDPGTYGMTLSPKIMELHQIAVSQDETNPRAMNNLVEYEIGSAEFFQKPLIEFCDRLNAIIPLYENQKTEEPFAPSYGIDRLKNSLKKCGCN